ncbi:MAG: amidohydrolase family protein [Nitrososphaerales archaeon]
MPNYKVIDGHVHFLPWEMFKPDSLDVVKNSIKEAGYPLPTPSDGGKLIEMLDQANVEKAFIISYVSPEVMGLTEKVNEFVSSLCAQHSDRLLAFCSPNVRDTVEEVGVAMDRLIRVLGVRGIKIHPCHQLVYPNEYKTGGLEVLKVIYEKAQEAKIPVMFHTGTSIFPRALNRFGDPIYIDDVAVDFPDLKILLAHGGRPIWMDTAFFLVRRHKNVYLDISSIPPKALLQYFPRVESIADKTMFGSDWPSPGVPSIRANVEAIANLPLSEEAKRKILRETALRVVS